MTASFGRSVTFEREVIERLGVVLQDLHGGMNSAGIRAIVHEVPVSSPVEECELRVDFLRDDELFDVIEFHLYPKGTPAATAPELANWIRAEVMGLIARARV